MVEFVDFTIEFRVAKSQKKLFFRSLLLSIYSVISSFHYLRNLQNTFIYLLRFYFKFTVRHLHFILLIVTKRNKLSQHLFQLYKCEFIINNPENVLE